MADILFISPNLMPGIRPVPVGITLLATILKNDGFDVKIQQFCQYGELEGFDRFLQNGVEQVKKSGARVITFYTRCDTYHICIRLAERIKEAIPHCYIVFGGPQSDLSAEVSLRELPYLDYVCRGEGETTVIPFFSSLLKGQPDHSVAGLAYREGDRILMNPKPKLLDDLDILPRIDYSLLDGEEPIDRSRELMPVDVGRGCPFGCTYCSTKSFWQQHYRLKSPERIVSEIQELYDLYHSKWFNFEHDMFTMNRKKVTAVCELLQKLDFQIQWHCSARMDCLTRELIDTMVASGLKSIYVGIETGSPRMQKLVNKNLKLDGIEDMIRYLVEKGVSVTGSFIYGFPQETEEDVSLTMDLYTRLQGIPNVSLQAHLCAFLPGTELEQQYREELEFAVTPSDITGSFALAECMDLLKAHPAVFSHYREYRTPLRQKVKYLAWFLESFKMQYPIYRYLAQSYTPTTMFDMYEAWVDANRNHLDSIPFHAGDPRAAQILVVKDRYWTAVQDTPVGAIATELHRYLAAKETAESSRTDLNDAFGFCMDDLSAGRPLSEYRPGLTVVQLHFPEGKGGKLNYKIIPM